MLRRKLQNLADYDVVKLPNGATLASHRRNDSLTVNVSIMFRHGMAYDPDDRINRSHFAEHMMFRKNSYDLYWQRINEYNQLALTQLNATCLADNISLGPDGFISVLPQNSPRLIRGMGEMIYDPEIELAHFNSEREAVYLEEKNLALSERYMHNLKVAEAVWGKKHPYLKAWKPGLDGVRRMKPQDIADAFEYLKGANVYIGLVGSFSDDDIRAVEDAFGKQEGKISEEIPLPEPRQKERIIVGRPKDLDQNNIRFNYNLPPVTEDDYIRARMIDRYLGDEFILYRILRDERSLCYGVGVEIDRTYQGGVEMNKRAPVFTIDVNRFREKNTDVIVDLVRNEVEKMQNGDIDMPTLERVRGKMDGEFTAYDSGERSAVDFAETELFGMKKPVERYEIMMAVTPEDIRRIAQTYMINPVISIELHRKNGHKQPQA